MFRHLILAAALIAVTLALNFTLSEEDKKIQEDCSKEVGYEPPKPVSGQKRSEEEKKKYSCMMKCGNIKRGLISEDGVLNADKIQEKLNADAAEVNAAVEVCKDKTEDDDCLKIMKKVGCVMQELQTKNKKN